MTVYELQQKVDAAEAKVVKLESTLAKHKASMEKYIPLSKQNPENFDYIYKADSAEDNYKTCLGKIKDAEKVLKNWKEKLAEALIEEMMLNKEVPESFKDCQSYLAEKWTEWDKQLRDSMKADREVLSYNEYNKKYSYTAILTGLIYKTDEQLYAENEKEAKIFILDLYRRVVKITGEVTGWENITFTTAGLNGIVKGINGSVRVETILAGGYNIQRLHMRVLTHEIK